MKNNSKKNFVWNSVGLTAYVLISFLLFVIVKNVNGTDKAGVFAYSFSLCTLFFYISTFYNRSYQVANDKYSFNEYITTRLFTSILSILLITIFSFISGFGYSKLSIILSLMIFRTFDSVSECFYGKFQSSDRLYIVGFSYFLKSLIGIIGFLICDIFTKKLLLSILVLDIINVIIFFCYDFYNYKKIFKTKIKIDFSKMKIILKNSLSVFIFSFLSVYLINSQKYIIVYYSSNTIQTIFSILIMPATVISLIGNYLIQPFLTKFIEFRDNKIYKKFNSLTVKLSISLLLLGLIVLLATSIVGIPVLEIIYQIELSKYKLDLILIIIGSLFISLSVIYSGILTVLNENIKQVFVYFIASCIATVSCIILIHNNIIRGAVLSYLVSSLFLFILFIITYILTLRKLGNNSDIKAKTIKNHKYKHVFVICAYKESAYLEECVKSLLNQTVDSPVYISTSTPNKLINRVAKKYHVELLINKKTTGHINDFNFAFNAIDTKYITLCHQDDLYLPKFAELTIKKMQKSKKPIIAFTDYYELRNGEIVKNNKLLIVKRLINFPLLFFKNSKRIRLLTLSVGNAICAPTITYNKDIIEQPVVANNFKSNIDWISYIEFAKFNGKFVYINKPLLHRRIHEESLTTSVIARNIKKDEDLQIFKMFWPDFVAKFLFKIYNTSEKSNDLKKKR